MTAGTAGTPDGVGQHIPPLGPSPNSSITSSKQIKSITSMSQSKLRTRMVRPAVRAMPATRGSVIGNVRQPIVGRVQVHNLAGSAQPRCRQPPAYVVHVAQHAATHRPSAVMNCCMPLQYVVLPAPGGPITTCPNTAAREYSLPPLAGEPSAPAVAPTPALAPSMSAGACYVG